MIKKYLLFLLTLVVFLTACKKTTKLLDANNKWVYVDSAKNGFVKFVHAYSSVTPALSANAGPSVQIYDNNIRLSGNALAYNGTIPAPAGTHAIVPAGSHNFLFIMNRISGGNFAPVAGDTVFKASVAIDAGKYYTSFLVDSSQNPGVLTVQDKWTVPNPGKYKIRFANLVPNPSDRYDVYADTVGTMIATNIGYRQLSDFIEVLLPNSTENFSVRKTGTTTVVYTMGSFSPTSQRVYTLYIRGRAGTTGRTPGLTYYTNR